VKKLTLNNGVESQKLHEKYKIQTEGWAPFERDADLRG